MLILEGGELYGFILVLSVPNELGLSCGGSFEVGKEAVRFAETGVNVFRLFKTLDLKLRKP